MFASQLGRNDYVYHLILKFTSDRIISFMKKWPFSAKCFKLPLLKDTLYQRLGPIPWFIHTLYRHPALLLKKSSSLPEIWGSSSNVRYIHCMYNVVDFWSCAYIRVIRPTQEGHDTAFSVSVVQSLKNHHSWVQDCSWVQDFRLCAIEYKIELLCEMVPFLISYHSLIPTSYTITGCKAPNG